MIATPNAGFVDALQSLTSSRKFAQIFGRCSPAILGTMSSLYQLLPHARHGHIIAAVSAERVKDTYDPQLWQDIAGGLANPNETDLLSQLLPEEVSEHTRREIALERQRKALIRAKHLAAASDFPVSPTENLSYYSIAGDAEPIDAVIAVGQGGFVGDLDFHPPLMTSTI